jgi:hypothetical protein
VMTIPRSPLLRRCSWISSVGSTFQVNMLE